MFGLTATGVYSPRLDLLQHEMSSGQYTSMADAAALGREISSVYSGRSGDMNAAGSPSYFDSKASMSPVSTDMAVNGPTSGASWIDQIKQWFSDHAMAFVLIVVGLVFLVGAFITWNPSDNAARLAAAAI